MRSRYSLFTMVFAALLLVLGAVPAAPAFAVSVDTPAGQNVQIDPFEELSIIFDNVLDPADTTVIRTHLEPGDRTTPCGNTIPGTIGLPGGDHFIVYNITTLALFTDSVEVIVDQFEDTARLFHAACPPNEDGFQNVTTLAIPGDPRARIPEFSEFVVGIDGMSANDILTAQLGVLRSILDVGSPAALAMDDETLMILRGYAREVFRARNQENLPRAYEILGDLINFVRAHSGTSVPNQASQPGGNAAGQLISIAASLKFTVKLLF